MITYYSKRNMPLVYWGNLIADITILTVENYCKWYDLYLIHADGKVEAIPFPDMSGISSYRDHVPNPLAVTMLAAKRDYYLCPQSLEIMVGRWEIDGNWKKYEFQEES